VVSVDVAAEKGGEIMYTKSRFLWMPRLKRLVAHLWTIWRSDGIQGVFSRAQNIFLSVWMPFWMRFAGLSRCGRIATRLATWGAPPYKARRYLSSLYPQGYVAPSATIYHTDVQLGGYVFIGDRVMFLQFENGGRVELGEQVHVYGDVIFETGEGGSIKVGAKSRIHLGCHFIAYLASIQIGCDVHISPNCAFYPHNHSFAPGIPISQQPSQTKGAIVIGDHTWLGTGVIVLSGVRIGEGAVIGAGAVVAHDIPDNAIAVGVPARVVRMRSAYE